jgi:hypothetical protein
MNIYLQKRLERHGQLAADMETITNTAAQDNRDVTAEEAAAYRGMSEEAAAIEAEIAPMRDMELRAAKVQGYRADVEQAARSRRETDAPTAGGQLDRYRAAGVGAYLADWGQQKRDPQAAQRIQRAMAEYRVVADQKLADNPGIVPIPTIGSPTNTLITARPFIDSVTNLAMPGGGSTFNRPKITQHTLVGVQATEKTQLASQKMTITSVPVTKKTFGGTLDISFQDRDWTDPAILGIAVADLAGVYAKETDNAAADGFVTATTGTFVLGASPASGAVRAAVLNAANQIVANVGVYPDTVWMAPDVAAQLGAIVETGSSGLPSFPGLSTVGSSGELLGLRSVIDVNFAAGTMIIGVSGYVEHYETVGGLLSVTEPTILGYTIAYYGYVADLLVDTGAALKRSLT